MTFGTGPLGFVASMFPAIMQQMFLKRFCFWKPYFGQTTHAFNETWSARPKGSWCQSCRECAACAFWSGAEQPRGHHRRVFWGSCWPVLFCSPTQPRMASQCSQPGHVRVAGATRTGASHGEHEPSAFLRPSRSPVAVSTTHSTKPACGDRAFSINCVRLFYYSEQSLRNRLSSLPAIGGKGQTGPSGGTAAFRGSPA